MKTTIVVNDKKHKSKGPCIQTDQRRQGLPESRWIKWRPKPTRFKQTHRRPTPTRSKRIKREHIILTLGWRHFVVPTKKLKLPKARTRATSSAGGGVCYTSRSNRTTGDGIEQRWFQRGGWKFTIPTITCGGRCEQFAWFPLDMCFYFTLHFCLILT